MEGTIHCKSAAAEVLVEQLYTTLTNRPTYRLTPRSHTFNDLSYQVTPSGTVCLFLLSSVIPELPTFQSQDVTLTLI